MRVLIINFKLVISRFSRLNQTLFGLIHNSIILLFKKKFKKIKCHCFKKNNFNNQVKF